MPKYRRMTVPGYTSPFISRMPGIPASMEDDREPEYDPDDPLGLSYGRVTCTMATLIGPWEEATAEVFTQDENGNWIADEESKNSRDMLIRSYRQWL